MKIEDQERRALNFRRLVARHLKKGDKPTMAVLLLEAARRGVGEERARKIVDSFRALNVYAPPARVPLGRRYHRGNLFPSLGHVQIDFAVFHPELRGYNNGHLGFILAVDQLSLRLTVLPTRSKSTKQWLRMVEEVVRRDPLQVKVVTDRDKAVTTDKFRDEIRRKYGVAWEVLTNRNKAYMAELMIRHVKRQLSIYMSANASRRWVDFVEPLVQRHNSTPVGKTGYTPRQVDWTNYEDFTRKLTDDPNFFESLNISLFSHTPPEALTLFKFDTGDRVRVDRRAHPVRSERRKIFDKPSVHGTYGPGVYLILGRGFYYVYRARGYLRIYELFDPRTEKRVPGTFYERDLKLVSTDELGPVPTEESVGE